MNATSLDLRGVMADGDTRRYYVYDAVKKAGVWAAVNETGNAFTIISEDAAKNAILVRLEDGRRLGLALRETKLTQQTGVEIAAVPSADANEEAPPLPKPVLTEEEKRWEAHRKAIAHLRFERALELQAQAQAGIKN